MDQTQDDKAIRAHLEAHECQNIRFDGAWVTFISRQGHKCYASRRNLLAEHKAGR